MPALHEDREAASAAAEKIRVFAQPQRLMILSCLLRGERNVGEIAEVTGIGQPALSQQLGELRRAELVETRKEAKQVWYRLANESVALCVRNIEAMFAGVGMVEIPALSLAVGPATVGIDQPPQGVAAFARILPR